MTSVVFSTWVGSILPTDPYVGLLSVKFAEAWFCTEGYSACVPGPFFMLLAAAVPASAVVGNFDWKVLSLERNDGGAPSLLA